jgi:hypothetical protein
VVSEGHKPGGAKPLDPDAVERGAARCLTCGALDGPHPSWCWRERDRDDLAKAEAWDLPAVPATDLSWLEKYRVAS